MIGGMDEHLRDITVEGGRMTLSEIKSVWDGMILIKILYIRC